MNSSKLRYLTQCSKCRCTTSKKYARVHGGMCKACAEPKHTSSHTSDHTPTREQRILDYGYQAYAREEGHFDNE